MDGHGLLDSDLCFFNGIIQTIYVQKTFFLELLLGGWSPNFLSPADGCIFNGRCNTKSWARCMLFDRIYHATCSKVVLIICNHCTSGRFVGPAKHQLLNGLHGLYSALENSCIPKSLPFMNAIGRFMRVNNQSTTWKVQPTLASTLTHWHMTWFYQISWCLMRHLAGLLVASSLGSWGLSSISSTLPGNL